MLALIYDFDNTLTPDNMQAQGYIQSVGYDPEKFWSEANLLAEKNDMDSNLAYMLKMVEEARGNLVLTRSALESYGAKVKLYDGVEKWFPRIDAYGKKAGVEVEHYVLSSGLKEMIDGTSLARAGRFKKIYASSFYFNDRGEAAWPAQTVNYTSKTQFLFRIEKGVLDINDPAVNDFFPPDKLRVPFRNMVYIGDSDTDIPCMKLVTVNGGHAIGVYDGRGKQKVHKMARDGRINYFAPADFTAGSELDTLIKNIIDSTCAREKLERKKSDDLRKARGN